MKRWSIVTFIAIFLAVSIFSHVGLAEAATSRVAIISKIEGTVDVKKSGGKKTLKGFKGMSLNQGDVVTTGKKSSVVLKFSNGTSEDDTFVLESSTTVTFSKLSNKSGTTTKVSMLKGKVWVDVKSIKNKDDEFVLETPTAIMGVRGTNFFVGVDPNTGLPSLAVLSGNVNVTGNDNNSDHFNVYPASALTVGAQDQLQMIPIDNQVLAQMLKSTSTEVMESILESAQKIISENQELMNKFTTSTFPTEINQFPLSQNQYTDNVYNLLLALAKEAFKLNKIDGNNLLKLQQQIKEQQLTNNELHQNTGDVDWKFELDALSEQQRQEKLLAEQAKKDALTNGFNASEQKAKEDKLKQDRLDALEKLWLQKLSQAERDKYEREKQERLEEEQSKNGSIPNTPKPTNPPGPSITWSDITKPFDVQLQTDGIQTPMDYIKSGNSITDLIIEEPILVNSDDVNLVFQSKDSSIQILKVTRGDESLPKQDDGVFRTHLDKDHAEMRFKVTVKHDKLGEKEFNLNVATTVSTPLITWEDIIRPFIVQLETDGSSTPMDYTRSGDETDDDYTNLVIEQPIEVNSYDVNLVFQSEDQSIQLLEVTRSDGKDIGKLDDGVFTTQLEPEQAEMRFTIKVNHEMLGEKEFNLNLSTVPPQWSDIARPFDLNLQKVVRLKPIDYIKNDVVGDEDITYLLTNEAIPVNTDGISLLFSSTVPSIQLIAVRQGSESLPELDVDNDGNADGVFRWGLEQQQAEMIFTITVEHSILGEKQFILNVDTVVQPFNIYELQTSLEQNFTVYVPAFYSISKGVSINEYVITLDDIYFSNQYIHSLGFEKKDDADEMLLSVKVGEEWQPQEAKNEGNMDFIHYPSQGTDSVQYKLVYIKNGITETYFINAPSIQW
ncbi:FecR domain-containing protein [Paenibacillus endoradicis]|uniref:FecR domain-containing protein n=1 Tax=Paenibacillus endoradicis TaxID=2972487 RepID=UPI002159259A|nr:FecR domain-containing protein [Paenibacillus endoradicis]MCR8659647.1 FecR domain-containing protein [Paenibacillus endoradicis]